MSAIAKSEAVTAWIAKKGFRLTQGISTNPQTGSQVSPKMFFRASATELIIWETFPPRIWVNAAAAIADATPHSAWHPPTAPARAILLETNLPTSPAVIRAFICSPSFILLSSAYATKTAGTIPQEPAVGQATIVPIRKFCSLVASAYVIILYAVSPNNEPAFDFCNL